MVHSDNRLLGDQPAQPEKSPAADVDFDSFFKKNFPSSVRMLMKLGASYQEAEDAVSSVMSTLYPRFHTVEHPPAYVRVAATRAYIKYIERERQGQALAARTAPAEIAPKNDPDVDERAWVLQQLRDLPAAQMEVMALTFDGYSPAEIAKLLGKDPQTIRTNLHQARRRLRGRAQERPAEIPARPHESPKEV
ncbi:RNA polymerase sigma factor [Micromonospora sp. PTRAS2]